MQISEIYKTTKKKLDNLNIESSEIDARVIIKNIFGCSDKELIMDNKISFSKKENDLLSKVITERLSGKPLSRIFGTKEFFSMDFVINKYVLDPRPDSEILVEEALRYIKENNFKFILEFGVGSGCIMGGILKNSEEVYALGVDISEKAINTAKVNLLKNNISNFDLVVGDWGSCINKKFDPNFHQAMLEVENNTKEPGTVVQEIQKGYMMKKRLLRPSLVGVAKKREEKEEKSEKK